jgi:hypothetical protein
MNVFRKQRRVKILLLEREQPLLRMQDVGLRSIKKEGLLIQKNKKLLIGL